MNDVDEAKKLAAHRACDLVQPGMRVGLGTGSTASHMVAELGRRVAAGLDIVGVPTSEATRRHAEVLGIPLATLDDEPGLDLTIDGADEIGPDLALVKGGGGALLREKLVAAASRRLVVIADVTKHVGRLGRFPLPIEVVPFGLATTRARLDALLAALDIRGETTLRLREGAPFETDGGHFILDAHCGAITDPERLARALKDTLGVVEHGLFVGMADLALIASASGVMEIAR